MASECKLTDVIAGRIGKVVPLEQKFNMFDKMECGESVGYTGRHFHIEESSITILTYSSLMQSDVMRFYCTFIKEVRDCYCS